MNIVSINNNVYIFDQESAIHDFGSMPLYTCDMIIRQPISIYLYIYLSVGVVTNEPASRTESRR